jgi:DNA-binding transcriptional LysR family regulator
MDRLAGLQCFVRVVEAGSFSKAAQDLNCSQPTITKQIALIEQRLGARLLNRNTRGISLTEAGLVYFERCKAVLREFDLAETSVGEQRDELSGALRIGTSMAFGRQVLAPWILDFVKQYPRLKVDISCDDHFVDMVGQGLDVTVRLGKLANSSLGCRFLGSNRWVMVAARSYLDRRGQPYRPEDLAAHDCLVYSTVQGDEVWRLRSPDGEWKAMPVNGPLKSNNLAILQNAVKAGLGLAIVPLYAAAAAIREGQIISIMDDHLLPEQEINAVFPSARFVPLKVSVFSSYLQQRFRGEWWQEAII